MIEYQSTPDFYNDYISHHGILGQKWGKQNGPPYPLGSDVSTGSRLKKGADSKGSVKKKSYKNRPDNLSELNLNKKSKEFYEKELENVKEPRQLKGDRLNEAATLGIKAMQELGDQDVQLDNDWKKWFVYEDQTIGLATIADLINQGKNKKQIKDLIDYADSLDYSRAYDGPVFELTEANRHSYPDIDSFIDACLKIKDNKKSQTKNVSPDNLSELDLKKKSSVPDNKLTNFVDNLFNKANSIDYKKEASKLADKAKPYADKAKDGIDKAFDKANEMIPPKDKKDNRTEWEKQYDKRVAETHENAVKSVSKDKNIIAKQVSDEMISDIERWNNKKLTSDEKSKLKKEFEESIIKTLDTKNSYVDSKGNISLITISGGSNYADNAPLLVEYDPKAKKIKYLDYL